MTRPTASPERIAVPRLLLRALPLALLLLLLAAPAAFAAQALAIRLVAASNDGAGVSPALGDVAAMLQSNLPFSKFELVDQGHISLPATGNRINMARGITVHCNGPSDNLRVSITSGQQQVVQTTLRMMDGKPVILGGIPYERGRLLILLIAR